MHAEDRIALPAGAAMAGLVGFAYGNSCAFSSSEFNLKSPLIISVVLIASTIWGNRLHENSANTQITTKDLNVKILKNLVCTFAGFALVKLLRSSLETNGCSDDDALPCSLTSCGLVVTATLTTLFAYSILMNIMYRIDRSIE